MLLLVIEWDRNSRILTRIPVIVGPCNGISISNDSVSFLYTAWPSVTNFNDQTYRGYYNTNRASDYLSFNQPVANYSDPFPGGNGYIFLSSTKSDSRGGYDLYIADINTGNTWSLSDYNNSINSVNDELGSCYTATQ